MAVNIETGINWFSNRAGKVKYSMTHRDGPSSYDCSSAIYYALLSAGASPAAWAVNTETEHGWLEANGYQLISENRDWDMQRGDIVIWGRKGHSIGAAGHTMLALNANDVIHCTYAVNGITTNNYNQLYGWNAGTMGGPYVYVYRQKGQTAKQEAALTTTQQKIENEEEDMGFLISAEKRGIALMQGGKFLPILDTKDVPLLEKATGQKTVNLSQKTFDEFQIKGK